MKTAILFLLLFVAATTSGLANPMIMINGPAAPLPVGNLFVVTVDIVRVTDLYAWPFDLNYELPAPQSPYPQVADLGVLSITEGSFLQNAGQTFFAAGTDDPVAESISFNVETLSVRYPGESGAGTLLVVFFQARERRAKPDDAVERRAAGLQSTNTGQIDADVRSLARRGMKLHRPAEQFDTLRHAGQSKTHSGLAHSRTVVSESHAIVGDLELNPVSAVSNGNLHMPGVRMLHDVV